MAPRRPTTPTEETTVTDTQTTPAAAPTLAEMRDAAALNLNNIEGQLTEQIAIKDAAARRIADLRIEHAEAKRIVGALNRTPRTRKPKGEQQALSAEPAV